MLCRRRFTALNAAAPTCRSLYKSSMDTVAFNDTGTWTIRALPEQDVSRRCVQTLHLPQLTVSAHSPPF
jgi:hypothetical protein